MIRNVAIGQKIDAIYGLIIFFAGLGQNGISTNAKTAYNCFEIFFTTQGSRSKTLKNQQLKKLQVASALQNITAKMAKKGYFHLSFRSSMCTDFPLFTEDFNVEKNGENPNLTF